MNQEDIRNVRRSIKDAETNEQATGIVLLEAIILSIVLGFIFSSWLVFGGILIGSFIMFHYNYTAKILAIGFTTAWVIIAYKIGSLFGTSAGLVLGVISIFVVGGIHLLALEGFKENMQ